MARTLVDRTQHRLPQDLRVPLEAIAEITGSGFHGVLRRAIESYLAGEGRDLLANEHRRHSICAGVDRAATGSTMKDTTHSIATEEPGPSLNASDDDTNREVDSIRAMLAEVRLEQKKLNPFLLVLDSTLIEFLVEKQSLDLLLRSDFRLLLTDALVAEAVGGKFQRPYGDYIADWFDSNSGKITILNTVAGSNYDPALELRKLAGRSDKSRPSRRGYEQNDLLSTIRDLELVLSSVTRLLVVTDDLEAREAVMAVRDSISIVSSEGFVRWANQK